MTKLALQRQQLRYVAKVSFAGLLAYLVTLGDRNEHALFSALGAAMVVGGSYGEDLRSSLNRVRGTLAGTGIGVALAYLLGTSIWSLGLSVALMAWLSVGLEWGAPAMRIGLAMSLVVLFTHASDAANYALWRAFNTMIGVGVGIAVSRFVWPVRGRDETLGALDRALLATAALLEALATGVEPKVLLPRQVQVLDALAAVRTARKNASVEQRLHGETDRLSAHVQHGARVALGTLVASLKLEELAQSTAHDECVLAIRQAIAPLAASAKDVTAAAGPAAEFAVRWEHAQRAAVAPGLAPDVRSLLAGVLADLRQVDAGLREMLDVRRRDAAPV